MSTAAPPPPATSSTASALTQGDVRSIIIALMLAILLGAIDQTIISVSLPQMATDLQGVDLLAWVVSGYLIAMAVATPIYGKLGDIYGRRIVLSSAIVLFLLASVACALAPSMPVLVAARILQGLGGGGLISVAQATIADVVAPRDRGRYQAYISGAFAIASVSGPVLGGLLTTYLSWRWIFWLNLPLGIPALLIAHRALAKLHKPTKKRDIDYMGAGLLTVGLSALLLGITRIGQGAHLMQPSSLWLLGITVVALGLYYRNARRTSEPIIPLDLFQIRTVTISCLILFIAFIQLIGLTVLIPLQLQMVLPLAADSAALRLIPLSLAVPLGAYIGGKLMTRTGTFKHIQLTGTLMVPIGLLWLSVIRPESAILMSVSLVLIGLGIGLQLPTSTVAVQNSVPHYHVGVATGVSAFCRSLGSALGAALLMAYLLMSLRMGSDMAGAALSGADIISLLVGEGSIDPADAGLQLRKGDITLDTLGTTATTAFQHVYRLTAIIAIAPIILTLLLKNERLSERLPPTASQPE